MSASTKASFSSSSISIEILSSICTNAHTKNQLNANLSDTVRPDTWCEKLEVDYDCMKWLESRHLPNALVAERFSACMQYRWFMLDSLDSITVGLAVEAVERVDEIATRERSLRN